MIEAVSNYQPLANLQGYSKSEINTLHLNPLSPDSPIEINPNLLLEQVEQMPLMRLARIFLLELSEMEPVKLTVNGTLPLKWVRSLYLKVPFRRSYFLNQINSITSELKCFPVMLVRKLLRKAKVIKVVRGKLSLTPSGRKFMSPDKSADLLKLLFLTFINENLSAEYDGYNAPFITCDGALFLIILLSKYGHEEHMAGYYATRYFDAFPGAMAELEYELESDPWETGYRCFQNRVITNFLEIFELVIQETDKLYLSPEVFVRPAPLFHEVFRVKKPRY